MKKNIYLALTLAVGVLGCPGPLDEPPCDTNDFCIETASCIPQSDGNWCTLVDPMNIEIEKWLQASVGNPYQVSVTAVGGSGPYTWQLIRDDENKLGWLTIEWNEDGSIAYLINKDGEFPTKADIGDIDLTIRLNDASIKGTNNRVDNQGFFLERTLTIVDTAAAPIFDPDPGTYNSDQQVSISCDTPDAKIYYTTNGDDPTTLSTEYTIPISVAGDQTGMTIKAISAKDGMADSMIVEGTYTISYDHILVIYHGNGNTGGEVPIDDTDYVQGDEVIVRGKGTLIKTGHEFDLWNTKSDGTGDDYVVGNTFNIGEENVNLYAQWTPYQTVAVPVFDPNPGTYNSDQQVSISCDTADARIFYTDNGDDPTTSSKEYTSPISVGGDQTTMTIRAISSKDGMADSMIVEGTYTISYDHISVIYHGNGNTGGEVPIDDKDYVQGDEVVVRDEGTLFKTEHSFECWNTKSDGTGDNYEAGATFNIGEDNVNLYAKWTPNQYTVTFDSQGGSSVASQAVEYGAYATAPADPIWTGYFFGGWYTEAGCENAWDFDIDTVTEDVELYAKWINTQTQTLGGVSFDLKYVPGGTFPTETADSGTATVSNAFWIGETEVTYQLWSAVYAWATSNGYNFNNPGMQGDGGVSTNQHPVTYINWRDAMVWCNAASEMAGGAAAGYGPVYKYNGAVVRDSRATNATACDEVTADNTAKGYRLPGSMEWECAARYRGTDTTNSIQNGGIYWTKGNSASGATASYSNTGATGLVAWYIENSDTTHAVKGKTVNTLGLFDMSGNVEEWCFDIFYKDGVSFRVLRGGSFAYGGAVYLQVGYVHNGYPFAENRRIGFRFLRTL